MRKLKEKLNAKLSKNGGFTLVEMLIVVAIIAILIAVSIPMVSGALERARHATDDANFRNAAALANIKILTTDNLGTLTSSSAAPWWYVVDSENSQGTLTQAANAPDNAVKAQCTEASRTDDGSDSHTGANIKVTFATDGDTGAKAKIEWVS